MSLLALIERILISYLTNASEIYQQYFSIGLQEADMIISIPEMIIVGLTPCLALLFDKVGKRCFGMIIGFLILMFGNLTFIFGGDCPSTQRYCYAQLMPMVLLGVGDSIVSLAILTGFTYVI